MYNRSNFSDVSSPTGSLCGIGALYTALKDTILSQSELTVQDYTSMRSKMFSEMSLAEDVFMNDDAILDKYYLCK